MASITFKKSPGWGAPCGPRTENCRIAPADVAAQGFMTFAENEAYLQKGWAARPRTPHPSNGSRGGRPHVQVDHVRVALPRSCPPAPGAQAHCRHSSFRGRGPYSTTDETVHVGPNCVIEKHAILGRVSSDLPCMSARAAAWAPIAALSTGDPLCGYDAG